jgi:hypothetical protein
MPMKAEPRPGPAWAPQLPALSPSERQPSGAQVSKPQIWAEVVDRHGADLILHGHAHHGKLDGRTTAGIPVHDVAITLLESQSPPDVYRVFEV